MDYYLYPPIYEEQADVGGGLLAAVNTAGPAARDAAVRAAVAGGLSAAEVASGCQLDLASVHRALRG